MERKKIRFEDGTEVFEILEFKPKYPEQNYRPKKTPIGKSKKKLIIDTELLDNLKFLAAESNMTVNRFINKVLKEYIDSKL